MKKIIALLLAAALAVSAAACTSEKSSGSSSRTEESASRSEETTGSEEKGSAQIAADSEEIENQLKKLEASGICGVVWAERDGKKIASYSNGALYNYVKITTDTPMPIGSVSKQFCAAAILILQERGRLSVNDTLDRYYPEYAEGRKITLHNMLSQRSGIVNLDASTPLGEVTYDKTDEENTSALLGWLFKQPLGFEPGDRYEYSNFNFILLGNIVEKVSGQKYVDFLRENIFKPLKMDHSGSVDELGSSPGWAEGFSYTNDDFVPVGIQPGLCKGAGDLVSNAADMTVWMNALPSGRVISAESYKAMTTDYSPKEHYGYGIRVNFSGGVGHFGLNGHFLAFDYINEKKKITLFMAFSTGGESKMTEAYFGMLGAINN